jgi:protein tyrosine phosphatase (PTP) superfamily phosphohydrolase (DUF442 family)
MTQRQIAHALFILSVLFPGAASSAEAPRSGELMLPQKFAPAPKAEAPVILCIDDKSTPGGQPIDHAYGKAAASGFRSILTFRSSKDGVDINRERFMVEKHHLRYFNLPVTAPLPSHKQIDEFLAWLRDKNNHPMLANCAYVERVAPYMMMFQMVELGWSEERAVEEASRSGLAKDELTKFARGYFNSKNKKSFRSQSR